jgi:hypothetical protein
MVMMQAVWYDKFLQLRYYNDDNKIIINGDDMMQDRGIASGVLQSMTQMVVILHNDVDNNNGNNNNGNNNNNKTIINGDDASCLIW